MENQFIALQDWTFDILEAIKKDIKSEHLGSDPTFYRAYFGNRPQNRLTIQEIFAAYQAELMKGNEELAEWVVNRWVFKHGDLYEVFANRLSEINPQFDEIEAISEEESQRVLEGVVERFGAIPTCLFVLLNGVVFPEPVRKHLIQLAEEERKHLARKAEEEGAQETLEKLLASQKREIARLQDKIVGVQKKYDRDTAALKKQIQALQKR